jgi:hypothetical protein
VGAVLKGVMRYLSLVSRNAVRKIPKLKYYYPRKAVSTAAVNYLLLSLFAS